jgi:hypothetical protein
MVKQKDGHKLSARSTLFLDLLHIRGVIGLIITPKIYAFVCFSLCTYIFWESIVIYSDSLFIITQRFPRLNSKYMEEDQSGNKSNGVTKE